jgi:hypothetical protein
MSSPETNRAERLAQLFHEAYERLAPSFGYQTREASAKPWSEVPENNRALMTAVCAEVDAARADLLVRAAEQLETLGRHVHQLAEHPGAYETCRSSVSRNLAAELRAEANTGE